jgi:D-alanyl-D-alanine carboxypeptidase
VEEVFVAGESPGRAEQQESSGEATGRKTEDPRAAAFGGTREASADGRGDTAARGGERDSDDGPDDDSENRPAGAAARPGTGARAGAGADTDSGTDDRADDEPGEDPEGAVDAAAPERTRAASQHVREVDAPAGTVTPGDGAEPAADGAARGAGSVREDVDDDSPETGGAAGSAPEPPSADRDPRAAAAASDGIESEEEGESEEEEGEERSAAAGATPEKSSGEAERGDRSTGTAAGPDRPSSDRPGTSGSGDGGDRRDGGAGAGTPAPSAPVRTPTWAREREPVAALPTTPEAPSREDDGPSGGEDGPSGGRSGTRPSAPETVAAALGTTPAGTDKSAGAESADTPRKASTGALAVRQSTFVPLVPQDADRPAKAAGDAETGALPPVRERTRQLPVPPVPGEPLKLLAELTNTPPPPQTPLRSVVRRFKIWTPLVVLLLIAFVVAQVLRPLPGPKLTLTGATSYTFGGGKLTLPWPGQGQSVVEVEGLGGLGTEGAQNPAPIASVTKVMTAYVILKDHPLSGKANGPTITVDDTAAKESVSENESTAKVKKGQTFTERQLLQLLLIPSGNNIARLLARWDAGSEPVFVRKMMKAAADLGMRNTTYTGASGYESTTRSTAVDQLKLARQVMKNDVFRQIVGTPNIDIPGVGKIYNNNNLLVNVGVLGIKTGSSTPAGGALMWAAKRTIEGKEQLILGVVLQQHGGSTVYDSLQLALTNSQKLINAVQNGLTSATVVKKGEVVGYVDDGLGGRTPVVTTKDLKAVGWAGLKRDLTLTASGSGIPHKAKAGTQVGTLGFGSGSAAGSVPVALKSDLTEPSFGSKLTRLG